MALKSVVEEALKANQEHRYSLKVYTERLEEELRTVDRLIDSVEAIDDAEYSYGNAIVTVKGSTKPAPVIPSNTLLSENSPFYEDADWLERYTDFTTIKPMKAREQGCLANAVKLENQRLLSLSAQTCFIDLQPQPLAWYEQNTEGIDWERVSAAVSSSMVSDRRRIAKEYEIRWLGYLHPNINKGPWSNDELDRLRQTVASLKDDKVDWCEVSEKLGTKRTPVDCMHRGAPKHVHTWNPEADQKLLDAVERYGQNNWNLVAMQVSENATGHQCLKRFSDSLESLNPGLRRKPWAKEEDDNLLRAIAAFSHMSVEDLRSPAVQKLDSSAIHWQDVAMFVKGRNNNHCRERWQEHLHPAKADWTQEEDAKLLDLVVTSGITDWSIVSNELGGLRTESKCRKRYNYLRKSGRVPVGPLEAPSVLAIFNPGTSKPDTQLPIDSQTSRLPRKKAVRLKPTYKGKEKANAVNNEDAPGLITSSSIQELTADMADQNESEVAPSNIGRVTLGGEGPEASSTDTQLETSHRQARSPRKRRRRIPQGDNTPVLDKTPEVTDAITQRRQVQHEHSKDKNPGASSDSTTAPRRRSTRLAEKK